MSLVSLEHFTTVGHWKVSLCAVVSARGSETVSPNDFLFGAQCGLVSKA